MSSVEGRLLDVAIEQIRGLIEPTAAERAAAYDLVVELTTRAPDFRVSSAEGSISDSLRSIEELFDLTRSILRQHGTDATKGSAGNLSLAVVAVRVLNEVFAPVLTRWRPRLREHEDRRRIEAPETTAAEWERVWAHAPQCRAELDAMASSVRAYIDTLSRIAGTPEVADAVLHPPSSMIFEQRTLPASAHPDARKEGAAEPRKHMVRWLSMVELIRSAVGQLQAGTERSVPDGPPYPEARFEVGPGEDFWFDYVADMGDAFDGTAPIAYLVGRHRITIPDDRSGEYPSPPAFLPRASLLVFGGDEVYPYATPEHYRNQTVLPYEMGVEDPGQGDRSQLVAIPGNHDWLGGIEHFEDVFVSAKPFAGQWDTVQDRLYWHVRLPQGWWLWGIDTGLDNEWSDDQVSYFEAAASHLRPGDRVVLCTPVPLWQLRQKYPQAYVDLRSALDPLIARRGATMPLCLSGDSHFFAHYERVESEQPEDHITAGGGGAFLQPTHNLVERVPHERGNAEFTLSSRWPPPTDSRSLAAGAGRILDPRNWPLAGIFLLLHLAYAGLLSVDEWRLNASIDIKRINASVTWPWSAPYSVAFLVVLVVVGSFTLRGNSLEPKLVKGSRVYGAIVGAMVALSFVAIATMRKLVTAGSSWLWPDDVWLIISIVIGGFLSLAVFLAGNRWANSRVRAGSTIAFSPSHSTRFKHFLRCRIDRAGDLTVYVIGVDPVGEGWYEAMTDPKKLTVPPFDPAGIPRIHYVWGRTYQKFVPVPMEIAVSVSDPGEDGSEPDLAFLALGSRLIDGGHTLMYGGLPPTYEGFTRRLREIEVARHADNPNSSHHLINYVADPYWTDDLERRDAMMRSIHVERPSVDGEDDVTRLIRDFTTMRRRMTADADVRIIIGGATTPKHENTRLAPGVLEEAYYSLESGQALIVVGGFGGAAGLIADAMFGRLDPAEVDRLERQFVDPAGVALPGERIAGFREMLCAFSSFGQLRNGLLDGENRELLTTSDTDTIVALVWRSMQRLGRQHHR